MGGLLSKDEEAPKGLVLVPPLFERDFRGRSRMTKSSYDWLFCKPGLKWLLNDYIRKDEAHSILRLRPSEDPRLTVHARLGARTGDQRSTNGRMALRFQPDADEPLTFVDIKTGTTGTKATARACVFTPLHDSAGFGAFVILPLVAVKQEGSPDAAVGMRYSTPTSAVGYIAKPLKQQLSQFWGVYQMGPFCLGAQFAPEATLANGKSRDLSSILQAAHNCASYAVSYSPEAQTGRSNFTAAVELKERSQLTVSLLYHMAVQRLCKNPLEDDEVVGITNYIDLGLQIASNLEPSGASPQYAAAQDSSLRVGASWQVNKNWMLKARVGSDSAAVAAVLKAWWQPSATFAVSAVYDFAKRFPRLGFTVNLENYGNIRYERSGPRQRMGKALVQRHVALSEDLANREGKGLLVLEKDLDNRQILGQVQPKSAAYL